MTITTVPEGPLVGNMGGEKGVLQYKATAHSQATLVLIHGPMSTIFRDHLLENDNLYRGVRENHQQYIL